MTLALLGTRTGKLVLTASLMVMVVALGLLSITSSTRGEDPIPRVENRDLFKISEAGDYIVPYSSRNTVRYQWDANLGYPNYVYMELVDGNGNVIRTDEYLPNWYGYPYSYAQYQWNGCSDVYGTYPLTDGSYVVRVVAGFGDNSVEFYDEAPASIISWIMTIVLSDAENYPGSTVSGTDRTTVTRTGELFVVKQRFLNEGGEFLDLEYTDPGPEDEVYPGVNVEMPQLIYTTPTGPTDNNCQIKYEMTLRAGTNGVLDHAGNGIDMNPNTDAIENKATWTFGMGDEVPLTDFNASYSVDP
jgi:hypothetical protein